MSDASTYAGKIGVIETNLGTIKIQFRPDKAPGHVENFCKLAESGYYDGTIFHRVIKGFMIQGGDPNGTGTGGHSWKGPGSKLKAEFNDIQHVPGTLSMARTNDPDSAGAQFFLCLGRQSFLDGKYTAFGQAIEGNDVIEKIGAQKTDGRDRPIQTVTMQKVTIEDA